MQRRSGMKEMAGPPDRPRGLDDVDIAALGVPLRRHIAPVAPGMADRVLAGGGRFYV
jgi:hypothetical protein